MKKRFFALIFCTAILCVCSANIHSEISENDVPSALPFGQSPNYINR